MSRLTTASSQLNGPYLNGNGRERFTVQEVLDGKPQSGSEGKTFEREAVLEGLHKIAAAIRTPEELSEQGESWDWEKGRKIWGDTNEAIAESGMSENIIARFALSEVAPNSIEPEMSPEDLELAQIVVAARDIARRFHRIAAIDND